jgi:hypothetical protein
VVYNWVRGKHEFGCCARIQWVQRRRLYARCVSVRLRVLSCFLNNVIGLLVSAFVVAAAALCVLDSFELILRLATQARQPSGRCCTSIFCLSSLRSLTNSYQLRPPKTLLRHPRIRINAPPRIPTSSAANILRIIGRPCGYRWYVRTIPYSALLH